MGLVWIKAALNRWRQAVRRRRTVRRARLAEMELRRRLFRHRRKHEAFQIGPNSHARKVTRWMSRGGGIPVPERPHVHPRRKRIAGVDF